MSQEKGGQDDYDQDCVVELNLQTVLIPVCVMDKSDTCHVCTFLGHLLFAVQGEL